jgi:L-lactate dehydrogenase complex protein LldG
MSAARDAILGNIRRAVGREAGPDATTRDALTERLKSRPRGIIPERGQGAGDALVDDFAARAKQVEATVLQVDAMADVPAAVAGFLAEHNQPSALRLAPHPDLQAIDWSARPTLEISEGPSDGSEVSSVTRCFAGIAETGTLMLLAGPQGPTTLNFLPENHVVVVKRSEMVGSYEDAWDKLRDHIGPDGMLTRVVNLITGPSRTADIEQTLELGAHGPIRLAIVIVAD